MKYKAILLFAGFFVFSAAAIGATPYTPSQTTPKVVIETIAGDITIELFPSQAPDTVDNFLQYVNDGFYDDLIIHRVTKNPTFKVVQGGGFEPGGIPREEGLRPPIINESNNGLSNLRGTVAMARQTAPNSATSQFYINVTNNSASLDYQPGFAGYCVFGQVISGMNIVDQIQQLPQLPPQYANGLDECPYYGQYWVYVFRHQVRVCVSPSGSDTTGLGNPDAPFKTIQKGIDIIQEPGHVVLAPATYTGAGNTGVDFKGKGITLRSIEPRDANVVTKTVIDCQGGSRAIYIHSEEGNDSVLKGLTIKNGYQTTSGGAIYCTNSSPTIKNCVIINNTAINYGGGIYFYNSDAVISNCTFSANSASLRGGAIYCDYTSDVTLGNSILWNNSSPLGPGIGLGSSVSPSAITVSYSDIDGGQAAVYAAAGCTSTWGVGNFDIDPRFVNTAGGDYHLQSKRAHWTDAGSVWAQGQFTSPCIETGNPGSDIGFEPNEWVPVRIEMGAYGGTTKASEPPDNWGLLADIDNDGTTDNFDFVLFAGLWKNAGSELPADLDRSEGIDIDDLKLFSEGWLETSAAIMVNKADLNSDGAVNNKDFAIWSGQWRQQGTGNASDLNNDAIVNIYDLYWFAQVWLR